MDQAGPPSKWPGGATCSFDGCRLTEAGFVSHRRMVEPDHPLELDLLEMGLDVLPGCLRVWQRAKVSRLVEQRTDVDLSSHAMCCMGCKRCMLQSMLNIRVCLITTIMVTPIFHCFHYLLLTTVCFACSSENYFRTAACFHSTVAFVEKAPAGCRIYCYHGGTK